MASSGVRAVCRDGRRFIWSIDGWSERSQLPVIRSSHFSLAGSERSWVLSHTAESQSLHLTCSGAPLLDGGGQITVLCCEALLQGIAVKSNCSLLLQLPWWLVKPVSVQHVREMSMEVGECHAYTVSSEDVF